MRADPRIAARARAVRRASRRRSWLLGGPAVLALAAFAATRSPLLDVDEVVVTGTAAQAVLDAARVRPGDPMVGVDEDAVARRVGALPVVASVTVRRDWPGTVRVEVVERRPAVAVPGPGGVALHDAGGTRIRVVPTAPPGLPVVTGPSDPRVVAAAATVVRSLPVDVRRQVARLVATTPDDLTLTLRSGATVVWGSPERSADKARVLSLLLPRGGRRFDLRSPDHPAVS